jgi:hypothetical protein
MTESLSLSTNTFVSYRPIIHCYVVTNSLTPSLSMETARARAGRRHDRHAPVPANTFAHVVDGQSCHASTRQRLHLYTLLRCARVFVGMRAFVRACVCACTSTCVRALALSQCVCVCLLSVCLSVCLCAGESAQEAQNKSDS